MEKLISKKNFLEMLNWSLESAPILDSSLSEEINRIHNELSEKTTLTEETYDIELNKKITNYIFENYSKVVLTEDEKIVGINEMKRTELFDAEDTKAHLDF